MERWTAAIQRSMVLAASITIRGRSLCLIYLLGGVYPTGHEKASETHGAERSTHEDDAGKC